MNKFDSFGIYSFTPTRRRHESPSRAKEVNLLKVMKKTQIILPQHKGSARRRRRKVEYRYNFPPSLLHNHLHHHWPLINQSYNKRKDFYQPKSKILLDYFLKSPSFRHLIIKQMQVEILPSYHRNPSQIKKAKRNNKINRKTRIHSHQTSLFTYINNTWI